MLELSKHVDRVLDKLGLLSPYFNLHYIPGVTGQDSLKQGVGAELLFFLPGDGIIYIRKSY